MTPEMTWIVLRATGLVALAALTLSVASGLAGPAVTRPDVRGVLVATHRSLATTGLALTVAHVVLAVLDSWVHVPALAAVVPGASAWEPLWIGVGALAVDLLVVVAVTSALRGRGPRTWWTLHALTYPAWLMAAAHAFAVGTDAWGLAFLTSAAVGTVLVAAAAVARAVASAKGLPVGVPRPMPTGTGRPPGGQRGGAPTTEPLHTFFFGDTRPVGGSR